MLEEGTFREDLYHPLNVVTIQLPPLRQRTDDIPILVDHFLKEISQQKHTQPRRISPEVMRRFEAYRWPGNVRELRNTLERMMVLAEGETLTENDLPEEILAASSDVAAPKDMPSNLTMEELERLAINKALEQCAGNRTHAAERLGISVRTLQRKLRHYEQIERNGKPATDDVLTRI